MEFRQQTEQERKDYHLIGSEMAGEKFKKEIIKHEQEAVAKKLPFAAKVAEIEFKEELQNQAKAILRKSGRGYLSTGDMKQIKLPKIDWSRYSDVKNFDLFKEDEIRDAALSKEHRVNVMTKRQYYRFKGYSYVSVVMESGDDAYERARLKLSQKIKREV